MNGSSSSLSILALFLDADIVVKGVMLLLLAASIWSWAVIIDKLWRQRLQGAHWLRGASKRAAASKVW